MTAKENKNAIQIVVKMKKCALLFSNSQIIILLNKPGD